MTMTEGKTGIILRIPQWVKSGMSIPTAAAAYTILFVVDTAKLTNETSVA